MKKRIYCILKLFICKKITFILYTFILFYYFIHFFYSVVYIQIHTHTVDHISSCSIIIYFFPNFNHLKNTKCVFLCKLGKNMLHFFVTHTYSIAKPKTHNFI